MTKTDGFYYIIVSGDTLSKIAQRFGIDHWKTIYNHKENEEFRKLRPNPNLIHPNDRIWIPGTSKKTTIRSGTTYFLQKRLSKGTVFDWYGEKLRLAGASTGPAAHVAERVFYLPNLDASIRVAEGPPPADWDGYHTGKHGVWERFSNLKGESVNMGELFFGEKYRWIRPEYKNAKTGELLHVSEKQFNRLMDATYENAPRQTVDLSGILDSEKFTKDIAKVIKGRMQSPDSTVWQGRYVYRDGTLGELQTNVDFKYKGHNWRAAIDAKTGRILNFFRIDTKYPPMKFSEIVIKWKGKITDVQVHRAPGSTIKVEISATWKGLLGQGIKAGAIAGGLVSGFLGAISGFKKEGIPGALKGLAIGMVIGAGVGGGIGGIVALTQRVLPWVGRVVKIGTFFLTVFAILLDSTETGLDPQECAQAKTDEDGNIWGFRNIHKKGTFFPEYIPHGIAITCTDGTIIEMGEEPAYCSSYRPTPVTVFAAGKELKWQMVQTPEGSRMWWWQDIKTNEEYIVTYRDETAERYALSNLKKEKPYRFI